MPKTGNVVQLVWGIALVIAGIGVLLRIPHVMLRIDNIEQFTGDVFFIRASFYLLCFFLICGGAQKIYHYFKK